MACTLKELFYKIYLFKLTDETVYIYCIQHDALKYIFCRLVKPKQLAYTFNMVIL
jgi:hypothetical protein